MDTYVSLTTCVSSQIDLLEDEDVMVVRLIVCRGLESLITVNQNYFIRIRGEEENVTRRQQGEESKVFDAITLIKWWKREDGDKSLLQGSTFLCGDLWFLFFVVK